MGEGGGRGELRSGIYFCNDSELRANEVGDRLNDNEDTADDDKWREEGREGGAWGGGAGGGTEGLWASDVTIMRGIHFSNDCQLPANEVGDRLMIMRTR